MVYFKDREQTKDKLIEKPMSHSMRWYYRNRDRVIAHQKKRAKTPEEKARRVELRRLNPERSLYRGAKDRSRRKNIECTITQADIVIPDVCPILQIPLVKHSGKHELDSPSLDRVDNSKGYVPGNVRVISKKANGCKSDLSIEQLERMYKYAKGEI